MARSLQTLRERFAAYLRQERFDRQPAELYEPNNYILDIGGKRLRPVLVLLGCELAGGRAEDALPAALAVEYFHNYTLIHDDIMDNARLRRGRETAHIRFGLNQAILAGDVLMIYAYEYLGRYDDALSAALIRVMNCTAIEVCEGQSMDLSFETRPAVSEGEYLEMIRLKTSVLLAAALKMGALAGGAVPEQAEALYRYGENLGLAFQMQDDLLDTYGDEQVGKQIGGDILLNKRTLLLIHALESAKTRGDNRLRQWLDRNDAPPVEKIEAVRDLYGEYGSDEYVRTRRDGYVNAALRELEENNLPRPELEGLIDLLVRRSY